MSKQWLRFEEFERLGAENHKTKTWKVFNADNGIMLGFVKWHGPWRQYCFFPYGDTVWNKDCMREVVHFIDAQMLGRKTAKQLEKSQ